MLNSGGLLYQVLCAAVQSHRLLHLNYRHYSRVVEPYAFGCDETGRPLLVAWQITGGCESGIKVGWKQFLLEEINGFVQLPEYFEPVRQPNGACNQAIEALKGNSLSDNGLAWCVNADPGTTRADRA